MWEVLAEGLGLISLSNVETGETAFFSPELNESDSSITMDPTELSELGFSDLTTEIV